MLFFQVIVPQPNHNKNNKNKLIIIMPMIYNNIDPVLLELGPLSIRYYGLAYAIGFIMSYFLLKKFVRSDEKNPLQPNDIDDLLLYIMLGVILGSRIIYIIIYNFSGFISNPLMIFQVWQGGMSFHGGLIGVAVAVMLFIRRFNLKSKEHKGHKKRLRLYDVTDLLAIPAAFSLAIGRLANFTNHELYGRVTDVPWAVKFMGVEGYRHPSQIYEAIYSVGIGVIEIFLYRMKLMHESIPKGVMSWSFVLLYGSFRFVTEFFRQPDQHMGVEGFFFGWLTMGHILSVIMIVIGGSMIYHIVSQDKNKKS